MTFPLPDQNVEPNFGELQDDHAVTRLWRGVQQNFAALAQAFPLSASSDMFAQVPQCRAYRTTDTAAIGNLAWGSVSFDLEAYDLQVPDAVGMHDGGVNPSQLTVRVAGTYMVSGCFEWANAAGAIRAARLLLNGAVVLDVDSKTPLGGGNFTAHSLDTSYRFAVGDYVEIQGFQDSGGGLAVLGAGNLNPYLAMSWIGA